MADISTLRQRADAACAWLEEHDRDSVERMLDWLRIPSVGTDPAYDEQTRAAGQWAVDRLREVGLEAALVETAPAGGRGQPIAFAHRPAPPGAPHVLFYGHYDVQPADPLELWESPPFEPVVLPAVPDGPGERVVARGACDDKGQTLTFLEALRAWRETAGEIPIGLTCVIEGEEESGSVNLERFLRDRARELRTADVCLISDTSMLGRGRPAITYGVRGLAYCEVVLHGADQDLHSGLWGGRAPNPINDLVQILSQLWDEKRRVTLPGFYDKVQPLTEEERAAWAQLGFDQAEALAKIGLPPEADTGEEGYSPLEREWARPTCDINGVAGGYQGPGAKTVIASRAGAKVSFRLVADQDPAEVLASFKRWLEERVPPGRRLEFFEHSGGPPATVSTESPHLQAARRAVERAAGAAPALIKTGGSIPVVGLFKSILGLDTILLGFGLDDDRIHSPNEKFELDCFRLGMRSHAQLLAELAGLG